MDLDWTPPNPGPWQQDRAHNPRPVTILVNSIYLEPFRRGFADGCAVWGTLIDGLDLAAVNGYTYHQVLPFDRPGPDGPPDPDWVHAEFGRRLGVAAAALDNEVWRDELALWDDEVKPAAQAENARLGAVELRGLDDQALARHVAECVTHTDGAVYRHHRFNITAILPCGRLATSVAGWLGVDPASVLSTLDGYSPISGLTPDEIMTAIADIKADPQSREVLDAPVDASECLATLESRHPSVGEYVSRVRHRLVDGFDVPNPTLAERPDAIVGKLRAAVGADADEPRRRADARATELRQQLDAAHQREFDELLATARAVYRVRDERGVYNDVTAIGLLRRAVLELGRRLALAGRVDAQEDLFEATAAELESIASGVGGPSAGELATRSRRRADMAEVGSPRFLGAPPPPPPPAHELPPPLATVMGSVGYMIEGILGQLDEPAGSAEVIRGIAGAPGVAEGIARLISSPDDLDRVEAGDIVVAPTTGEAFNSIVFLASGMVTDFGSFASHAAIVSREVGIPAVVGTNDGSIRIPDGARVRVDGTRGEVTILS